MSKLDFILLIPIVFGFVTGIFKGFMKEISSLAAIVLGIFGAKWFAPILAEILEGGLGFSPKMAMPVAYLLLFVIIAIGLFILSRSLEKLFESLSLGGLNKLLGGVFGALKFALIISVLLVVFNAIDVRFQLVSPRTKEASFMYQPLLKLAPELWDETKKSDLKETL